MKFEYIGGSSRESQYSLYDFSENEWGESVMSIAFHHESGDWWFVGSPKSTMTKDHMLALNHLLEQLIEQHKKYKTLREE